MTTINTITSAFQSKVVITPPYRPRKNTYEADIVDNLINAGGGAEKESSFDYL
jgi:hypothetical protein